MLKSFQYFGLCPISLNLPNNNNNNDNIVANKIFRNTSATISDAPIVLWTTICFIFMCLYAISISIYYRLNILIDFNEINKFTASVKLESVFITHLIIIYESLMTKNSHTNLWQRINGIDKLYRKLNMDPNDIERRKLYRNDIWKFFTFEFIALCIEINMLFIDHIQGWSYIRYATILSIMITRTRHLQHTFYIDTIRSKFSVLHHELKKMIKKSTTPVALIPKIMKQQIDKKFFQQHSNDLMDELADELKIIKNIYTMLYEITLDLNTCFGLSQLANITLNFIETINDLYWLYAELNINLLTDIWARCALLLPICMSLSMLMYSCEECLREVFISIEKYLCSYSDCFENMLKLFFGSTIQYRERHLVFKYYFFIGSLHWISIA